VPIFSDGDLLNKLKLNNKKKPHYAEVGLV